MPEICGKLSVDVWRVHQSSLTSNLYPPVYPLSEEPEILGILDGRGSFLWREVEGWHFLPDKKDN